MTQTHVDVTFRATGGRTAPLTWGQQRVADLLDDLRPHHTGLNLHLARRMRTGTTLPDITSAITAMLVDCESLRTRYRLRTLVPEQCVEPSGTLRIAVTRATAPTMEQAEEAAAAMASTEFTEDDLPIRLGIIQDGDDPAYLLFAISHLSSDFIGTRWLLWYLRDLLEFAVAFPDGRPGPAHPVDVGDWESSDAGRREGARALARHERSLVRMPRSMAPRLPREPCEPRYRYLELGSTAAARALSHVAARHGVSETAAGYAVLALLLAHAGGLDRAHLQVCVGNRVDRRFATTVGSLTQDVPTCIDMVDDLDTLLRRSAGAVRQATLTGRFPHTGLTAVRRQVELARGFPLDLSFWLNSRLPAAVPVDPPTTDGLRAELGRSAVRRLGGDRASTSTLFTYLDRFEDTLYVRILVDTAYLDPDEAETWLRAFEAVLVHAALHPEPDLHDIVTRAGLPPFRPTADWVLVDHSWIHLPSTTALLRQVFPGAPLRLGVEGPENARTLVAYGPLPTADEAADVVIAERLALLRDCKVAALPRRVIPDPHPAPVGTAPVGTALAGRLNDRSAG